MNSINQNQNDRDYCLVPDCDEAPYPGDQFCLTHQREEMAEERKVEALVKRITEYFEGLKD